MLARLQRCQGMDLAVGPGSAFGIEDIEAMPSIARQIRDVIRIDPRVSLGRADNGAGSGINCLGRILAFNTPLQSTARWRSTALD